MSGSCRDTCAWAATCSQMMTGLDPAKCRVAKSLKHYWKTPENAAEVVRLNEMRRKYEDEGWEDDETDDGREDD